MLQFIGTAEEAQECISIFTGGKSAIGRRIQLLGDNKVADGFVSYRDKSKEWRVPNGESISWRYKQNMAEQLRL